MRRLVNAGGTAAFFVADALDKNDLIHARNAIENKLGAATILINAAGGNRPEATLPPGADFCELPGEAWQDVFDLNLVGGALLPCQVWGETMVREWRGFDHQYRVDGGHDSAFARRGVWRGQSRRP